MRIFTEKPLVDFIENNPQYRVALQDWASKVKKCEWESIQDITNDFSDAQIISDVQCNFPLNIGGISNITYISKAKNEKMYITGGIGSTYMGEAFTGDIPAFEKTESDTEVEDHAVQIWLNALPSEISSDFKTLFTEMNEMQTSEARLYKALDKLEALIQHNEADLSTWLPLEYDLQFHYGAENVKFSPWFQSLKAEIDGWTKRKIAESK